MKPLGGSGNPDGGVCFDLFVVVSDEQSLVGGFVLNARGGPLDLPVHFLIVEVNDPVAVERGLEGVFADSGKVLDPVPLDEEFVGGFLNEDVTSAGGIQVHGERSDQVARHHGSR